MVSQQKKNHHGIKVTAPYYASHEDGTMLHRYMDDQFIERFQREASSGKLTGRSGQHWLLDDRFGKDRVVLRLPIHRTFYVVSCEVCCDRSGSPALDPARILSVGMVVRKGTPLNYETWQMRDGIAIGWRSPSPADHNQEPDHYRRLLNRGLIKSKPKAPPYSGEQTHPLHVQLINEQSQTKNRSHTLLFGYLPLSGSVEASLASEVDGVGMAVNGGGSKVSASGQMAEHQWPFGSWDNQRNQSACECEGSLSEVVEEIAEHFHWNEETGLQVDSGLPTSAFVGLLRTLMYRYQIFNSALEENEALRSLLSEIYFYDGIVINVGAPGNASISGVPKMESLLHYLEANREAILVRLADYDQAEAAGKMPENPLLPNTGNDLYILREQATELRAQLVLRAEKAEQLVENSCPLPRYTQGNNDYYFVVPFVRYRNECGKEEIVWGEPSQSFRVANPLDAEAARPVVIQLPEYKDLRRGFAKGVTFLAPKDIAEKLGQIAPDMSFSKRPFSLPTNICGGFSISFSIPIITICAMIILMIVLNLLNIIFFWLPWAFLQIPRLCRK